jgi:hypothetical protein
MLQTARGPAAPEQAGFQSAECRQLPIVTARAARGAALYPVVESGRSRMALETRLAALEQERNRVAREAAWLREELATRQAEQALRALLPKRSITVWRWGSVGLALATLSLAMLALSVSVPVVVAWWGQRQG